MATKSKFKSFILSSIPGLGHIYQGFTTRGVIFMGAFIGIIFLMHFLEGSGRNYYGIMRLGLLNGYKNILGLSTALIWGASIIDNLIFADKLKSGAFTINSDESNVSDQLNDKTIKTNRRLVAILLNIVPGAGHIYIGLKNKGLQLTASFFILYFVSELINIELLNVSVGLLWLYCILDTINITSYNHNELYKKELIKFEDNSEIFNLKNKMHWLGAILIFLGILILANRAAAEFIDPEFLRLFSSYLKDGVVSLVLILLGVKMLLGNKKNKVQAGERN